MPVFGADPDVQQTDFPEYQPTLYLRGELAGLVSNFSYAPQRRLSHRIENTEKAILAKCFGQALRDGYSVSAINTMIKRFWQSWGSNAEQPVYVFVSKGMQDELREAVKTRPPEDPYLLWLFNGMPDNGPFQYHKVLNMRKAVMTNDNVQLQYPDVVAAILREDNHPEWTYDQIKVVSDLIKWHNGDLEEAPVVDPFLRSVLPSELLPGEHRHPSYLRPRFNTVHQAIAQATRHERSLRDSHGLEERDLVA